LLGVQGGYLYFPPRIEANPESTISFSPDNRIKVPYWYYQGENRVPSLESMEKQLSSYINNNLPFCVNSFRDFKEKFFIKELGSMETKTAIGEEQVAVTTRFPVEASIRGESLKTEIKLFNALIPVPLKKIHDLAVDIFNAENQNLFLEEVTLELMTAGPDIPFSDIVFTCNRLRWKKGDIINQLKNLLYYNLPRIRFANAKHAPFLRPIAEYEKFRGLTAEDVRQGRYPKNAPPDLYDYYHFYIPVDGKKYADLQANVRYQKDWSFFLNARPSRGDILDASYGRGFEQYLKFLCVNAYHFTYDVTYPIEIVIQDSSAFHGNGYMFQYAMPVTIDHNQGNKQFTAVIEFQEPERGVDYCEEKRAQELLIYTKDKTSFFDLTGVNLTFNCLNTYYCDLGSTRLDGGVYRLRTRLPEFCKPGSVIAEKEGYLRQEANVLTGNVVLDIPMVPLEDISFRVVKQQYQDEKVGEVEHLGAGEKAFIYLIAPENSEYVVYRQYPTTGIAEEPEEASQLATMPILLDDTTYSLNLILFDANDKIIGGYRGNFTLSAFDAARANELVFIAIAFSPPPKDDEELGELLFKIQDLALVEKAKPVVK
ncbi:hypothetical protein HYS48_02820, partial [Candidatus Woesearchaeota archaeon]|nr:hypothetical protein [Candidatus Woesearchaeota archaeon]